MADVAAVRINNIVTVTHGTSVYKGVRSVDIAVSKGNLLPILVEGELYPSGGDDVGNADFPVSARMTFETDPSAMLAALAAAVGSLVIVFKATGGNKTVTIANFQFRTNSTSQRLQSFGLQSVDGVAYSATGGSALPISQA